ncbi:diacylglycerol/lipid kinase family protein [Asanoa siamensis]|uniref:Diacylglycerol kinase n=1 Tax=Asanoa siamensis TaxID=926357 RepID=A0ABQ4D4T2_9ACTN|nr:YegS/Rv2252/BmrU family lipid kinase [Asanoa siamensis]GIF78553.1 diacylglycerol kinase [Asanoa siamensis]
MRTKPELTTAIRDGRRAVLLVNAHSRRGRRLYPEVLRRVEAAGFALLGTFPVEDPNDLRNSLAAATDLGPDLLVVGGGDGTIGAAARHLAHRDVALGLLPLGTTNNFARTLSIPLDLDAAVGLLTGGKVIDVDLGLAGDMPFANHVGIGLSAEIFATAPPRLKKVIGRLAYPATALALLTRHRPMRVTVRTNGRSHEYLTHQLYVANGGFHAGRPITADADADDRLLVAYPVGDQHRVRLLRETARNAATGHRRSHGEEPFLATDEILVETDRPMPIEVDGEPRGYTPVRIGLAANALRVMAATDTVDR